MHKCDSCRFGILNNKSGKSCNENPSQIIRDCVNYSAWQPITKTLKDLEYGDIVIDLYNNERKVLAVLNECYLLSFKNVFEKAAEEWHYKELEKLDYQIKGKSEPKEMTVAEISKELGYEIKIIKEESK